VSPGGCNIKQFFELAHLLHEDTVAASADTSAAIDAAATNDVATTAAVANTTVAATAEAAKLLTVSSLPPNFLLR